jgi:hypothetical protein
VGLSLNRLSFVRTKMENRDREYGELIIVVDSNLKAIEADVELKLLAGLGLQYCTT